MKLHALLRLAIVMLFVACFFKRAGYPPLADEIDFLKPLHDWVTNGPQRWGVFHAPYYPWLESGLGRLFGVSASVFRVTGFVTTALGACFAWLAAHRVQPQLAAWRGTMLLALTLAAPYALGSALVLDHDPTVLLAATALYFYLLTRHEHPRHDEQGRLVLVFGLAFALCLMAKESTSLVYPFGLFVLLTRPFGTQRALLLSGLSWLLGVAVFLALTAVWCAHYDIALADVFAMDTLGLRILGVAPAPWSHLSPARMLWLKVMPAFWLGLPLTILFAARLPALLRAGGAVRAITSVVLVVILAYSVFLRQTTYLFPKYMAPVLIWIPWLMLVPEPEGQGITNLRPENFRSWAIAILAWFLVSPVDPMSVLYARDAKTLGLGLALLAVPTAIWAVVRYLNLTRWAHGSPRPATLALLLSIGLALLYCRTAVISRGSVTYWYGDKALPEARSLIVQWRAVNPTGRIFIPAKDLAYDNRDLGAQYLSKDELADHGRDYCKQPIPMLVVTRVREDSSLSRAPEFDALRRCMGTVVESDDIASASIFAAK